MFQDPGDPSAQFKMLAALYETKRMNRVVLALILTSKK